MAEMKHNPCDLVIVRADNETYLVEVQRDLAKLGDRVDILVKDLGMVSGFVEDILQCGVLDDLYCFIGTAVQIHKPVGVYHRVWLSEQLSESLIR